MRILILSNLYPPLHLGGYERRCAEVVVGLRQRGHSVHVLTSRFGCEAGGALPREEPSVSRALHFAHGPPFPPEPLARLLEATADDVRRTEDVIAAQRPDVIDLWGMDGAPRAYVESLLSGCVPIHLTVEDIWPAASWRHDALGLTAQAALDLGVPLPPPVRHLCGNGIQPLDVGGTPVTFVSHALRSACAARGFSPALANVRLAGLDLSGFAEPVFRPPSPFVIVAIGQLTADRGFEELIAAASAAAERLALRGSGTGLDILVRIVGGGSAAYESRLARLCEAATTQAVRFQLTGVLPPVDVQRTLAVAHLFVHPSRLPEGLPRVVAEALASGVPVVTSDAGGQRDLLENGRWGRLYPSGSIAALTDALVRAFDDRWHNESAVRAAADEARKAANARFDFDAYVDGHLTDLMATCEGKFGKSGPISKAIAARRGDVWAEFGERLATAALRFADRPGPLDSEALFRVAITLKRTGRMDASAAAFDRLLECGHATAVRRATFHRGEIALAKQQWSDAATWLKQCLAATPDHRKADYDLTFANQRRMPPHLDGLAALMARADRRSAARSVGAAPFAAGH